MGQLTVHRMHGLGNTVLLVDVRDLDGHDPQEVAQRWCAEAAADCMLLHERTDVPRHSILNADGTPAELCGNGLRCLIRLGIEQGWYRPTGRIESPVGTHEYSQCEQGIRISMPTPQFGFESVAAEPTRLPGELAGDGACLTIELAGHCMDLHLVSTGNPHAVIPCSDAESLDAIDVIGPVLEAHLAFECGINVHLVHVRSPGELSLRSWERGVGPTQACATGATAAVAGLARAGLADSQATVSMPGGVLCVEYGGADGTTWNSGPADHLEPASLRLD